MVRTNPEQQGKSASKRAQKQYVAAEWAQQTRGLRTRLGISQGELARRLDCSAMTVSRWEKGRVAPTSHYYIELGKLAGEPDCWFYWERAGLQSSDVVRALPEAERRHLPEASEIGVDRAEAGSGKKAPELQKLKMAQIPVLQAIAGTHGGHGDKRDNLNRIPAREVLGAPLDWCPNPKYTSLLRVSGHSMEPLIHNGDIAAVDSSETARSKLDGKVVIASNHDKGLCVSRFRRYPKFDILESENREYRAVVLGSRSGWQGFMVDFSCTLRAAAGDFGRSASRTWPHAPAMGH